MTKKLLYRFLCLAGLFLFWGLGIYYAEEIKANNSSFSIYFPEQSIVQKDFIASGAGTGIQLKLINYLESETVTGNINREDAIVTVAEVYSNTLETLPFRLLAGEGLCTGDLKGCIIDKDSAFHIFGTAEAVGNELLWDSKTYMIRGVIDSYDHMLVVYEPDQGHTFQNAELVFPVTDDPGIKDNKLLGNAAEEFLKTSVNKTKGIILDGQLAGSFLGWIILFPAYLMIFWFIVSTGRRWYVLWKTYYSGYKKVDRLYRSAILRRAIIRFCLLVIAFTSVVLLMIWVSGLSFWIPVKFIPNGWSNLKSYAYAVKEMTDNIGRLWNIRLYAGDLILRAAVIRCMLFVGAALFMLIAFLNSHKTVKSGIGTGTFLQPICSVLIILAVCSILYQTGFIIHAPGYYWLLLPVYMAFEEIEGFYLTQTKILTVLTIN